MSEEALPLLTPEVREAKKVIQSRSILGMRHNHSLFPEIQSPLERRRCYEPGHFSHGETVTDAFPGVNFEIQGTRTSSQRQVPVSTVGSLANKSRSVRRKGLPVEWNQLWFRTFRGLI